jgi:hypothetical protein
MRVLFLDDVAFAREPNVGLVIIKITIFAFVTIIGFDPHLATVGNFGN